MAKTKKIQMTAPRGTFKYPNLIQPDMGTKEFPKPDGEYNVRVILDNTAPSTAAFIKKLQPHYDAAMEKAAAEFDKLKVETRKKLKDITRNDFFTVLYDKDTEEETGEIEFKFKMKAAGKRKDGTPWSSKPGLFDAGGRPLKGIKSIWGGSEGIVSFSVSDYFIPGSGMAGITLRLEGVQILDLVAEGQRSADSYGFEAQEGYEHDDEAEEEATVGDDDEEDTSNDVTDGDDEAHDEDDF